MNMLEYGGLRVVNFIRIPQQTVFFRSLIWKQELKAEIKYRDIVDIRKEHKEILSYVSDFPKRQFVETNF